MLLTEGHDCPTSRIVVLRPTRSRPLFAQMVGRGTRIAPGKDNLLLLDFLWLHSRLKIVHPASLIAKNDEEAEAITRLAEEQSAAIPADLAELCEVNLIALASEAAAEREESLRKRLEAMATRKSKYISAEEFAVRNHQMEIAEFVPTMKWHSEPVSEKQKEWVEKVESTLIPSRPRAGVGYLDAYFSSRGKQPASHKQKWAMRQAVGFKDGTRTVMQHTR